MIPRREFYDRGRFCFSCGLCFARGTHPYAIAEYLPEGRDYSGITFLVCTRCGTAHGVEHASGAGNPDRLRTRRGPLFLPISPSMRRGYREQLKEQAFWKQEGRPPRIRPAKRTRRSARPHINLLPPPPWKRAVREATDSSAHVLREVVEHCRTGIWLISCLPYAIYWFTRDFLWDVRHQDEPWQQHCPIWVDSPETFALRRQQLLELHQNFEALWPVVEALPAALPSGDGATAPDAYSDLVCTHCATRGSLIRDLPDAESHGFEKCPCCAKEAVYYDALGETDTTLYLCGDVLAGDPFYCSYRHEWVDRFSSFRPPRSETAMFRLTNGGLKPHRITEKSPPDSPQIEVPPGHTYEVYLKGIEDESRQMTDPTIAHYFMFEVIAVKDVKQDGKYVYCRETPE